MQTVNPPARIQRETSISDLLRDYPQAIPVFLKHRMACVGCSMAAFETIESATSIYGIALDAFMKEVMTAISEKS